VESTGNGQLQFWQRADHHELIFPSSLFLLSKVSESGRQWPTNAPDELDWPRLLHAAEKHATTGLQANEYGRLDMLGI